MKTNSAPALNDRNPTTDTGVKKRSPFQKAATLDKRLKVFLWGDSGAGKTTLSLQFPNPAVIDLEGGADLYGDSFDFDVLRVTTADEAMRSVQWLLQNEHPYRTLTIDPITVYWDALQKKWSNVFLRRNKGSKGYKYDFYDLQPRDWMTIKAEFKSFVRKLIALDVNVIVTARQKVQYADGAFMKAIGETFDGEKSLPYLFDIVLRLYRDEKSKHMAKVLKDRTGKLPSGEFEVTYAHFEKTYGDILTREAKPIRCATEEQKQRIREFIACFQLSPDQVSGRLAAYGAENLDDLSGESASVILQKFESALAAKKAAELNTKEV